MLRNISNYKNIDLLNDNYKDQLLNLLNPFEYNIESNLKDQKNSDIVCMKSKSHNAKKLKLEKK